MCKKYLFEKYLVLILFILPLVSSAQQLKFKEFFPLIGTDSITFFETKTYLNNYIKNEPDFGVAYYMLAKVYMKQAFESNILTKKNIAIKYATLANENFAKAKTLITEKHLNKYEDYLLEFKKKKSKGNISIEYKDISNRINLLTDSNEKFIQNIKIISNNFINAKKNYDEAKTIFFNINNKYVTLNQIYLSANKEFITEAEKLKAKYDTAEKYINLYIKSIQQYPISYCNQNFIFKEIGTYRLDGFIANESFMIKDVVIWNYSNWISNILIIIKQNITELRKELITEQKNINDALALIKDHTLNISLPDEYKLKKSLLIRIKRYEDKSLAYNLLLLQKHFTDVLLINKKSLKDTSYLSANKTLYITKSLESINLFDSAYIKTKQTIDNKYFGNHADFFIQYWKDLKGINTYISMMNKKIDSIRTRSIVAFIDLARNQIVNKTSNNQILNYKNTNLTINDELNKFFNITNPYINRFIENESNQKYIAGEYYQDSISPKSFVAKLNKEKISWLKIIDKTNSNTFTSNILLNNGNIELYYSNFDSTSITINKTIFNPSGKEISNKQFPSPLICRKIISATNGNIMILKGKELKNTDNEEELKIIKYNEIDSLVWENTFYLKGKIIDAVQNDKKTILLLDVLKAEILVNNAKLNIKSTFNHLLVLEMNEFGEITKAYYQKTIENHNLYKIIVNNKQFYSIISKNAQSFKIILLNNNFKKILEN